MRPEYQCPVCSLIWREPGSCFGNRDNKHPPATRYDRRKSSRKVVSVDVVTLLSRLGAGWSMTPSEIEKVTKQMGYQLEEMRAMLEPKKPKRKSNELTTRDIDKKTGLLKADKRQAKLAAQRKERWKRIAARTAAKEKTAAAALMTAIAEPLRIRRPAMTNA